MNQFISKIITKKTPLLNRRDLTSGQAIVIIAVAAMGLFAMMGLAIDGGRLLMLRRDTQNAADAAAVAAARALCVGRDPVPAGLAAANVSGFDNNETDNWVEIHNPPSASMGLSEGCDSCFVEATIRSQIPPTFIGLVYGGDLETTSSAIGTCNPDMTDGGGAAELRALWAMGTSCPNASVSVTGSDIYILGGVHSNGNLQVNAGGGGHTGIVEGPSSYVDTVKNKDKVDWVIGDTTSSTITTGNGTCTSACFSEFVGDGTSPYPGQALYQTDVQTEWPVDYKIEDFRPEGAAAEAAALKGEYYQVPCGKGKQDFTDWAVEEGLLDPVTKTLKNGIYYSTCDFQLGQGGGKTIGGDDLKGNVTFVSEEEMHINGARHDLHPYYENLLVFCNDDKKGVHFSGTQNHWDGNIYVPNSDFQTSGSSNNANDGCVIAQCINFSGSNNVVNCQPSDIEPGPPGIWIAE
ncbi:MAG: hypothetical protein JXA10_02405 [Anaerolineae bacterium]|nr:hypothetical protein [Anaerolineae bacterium]